MAVAISIFRTSRTSPATQPPASLAASTEQATPGATPAAAAPDPAGLAANKMPQISSAPIAPSVTDVSAHVGTQIVWASLRAQAWTSQGNSKPEAIGSLDPASDQALHIEFSEKGAGLALLQLTRHFINIKDTQHVTLQSAVPQQEGNPASGMVPLSVLALEVTPPGLANQPPPTPVVVPLFDSPSGPLWRIVPGSKGGSTAQLEALIADANNKPALRITRTYSLTDKTGGFLLDQRVENLTTYPVTVRWYQMGQIDLPQDALSYGGDKRRLRFGHLLEDTKDPTRKAVVSDDYVITHDSVLGSLDKKSNAYLAEKVAWPNALSISEKYELVWMGMTNRYFSVAAFPVTTPLATGVDLAWQWIEKITRIYTLDPATNKPVVGMRLDSKALALAPSGFSGSSIGLPMNIYAGPLERKTIHADTLRESIGLDGLVVYNFGGPCGPCTFGWVTSLLIGLLRFLHNSIFFDWAVAIVFLVVIVRSILHPVTRWSQIRIQRFGKQMSAVGPKQKELQEKYKDDPKKLQVETARLWKEEGINPAGMLGCIPMFLQTPVWIALYATLYFAFELRHQGGFYGVFQVIQPTSSPFWQFMGDLAEPDRLIYFGKVLFTVPLLGPIESFNILPLILGVVFFIQQKYLTPPSATKLTPEMEMQQTMMKWMMVVMFPVFMYNAPSGLAVYFIANSVLGILESKWIKHYIDKHGLLDLDKMKATRSKKGSKSGGNSGGSSGESFIERIQRLAEDRQKQLQKDQLKKK
mgnify:CR=1 FL=1